MSNTYCPFIDHQLMIDFRGKVSACCQFEDNSTLENYNSMIQPYKAAMERGEQIKPCRRCWEDEAKGFPSLRHSAIKDFKRYQNHSGLMILDIRINNKCNLACTMCSDHQSSLWGKITGTNKAFSLTEEVKKQILEKSNELIKVSIQGGEPFYGNEFVDFVDQLPNKSNMQIEIFSNTVTINVDVLKRWVTEFNNVMLIISADGYGPVFESIRWPASWEKLERKIEQIKKIEGIAVNFNFSLQNLNVLDVRNFINWRNERIPTWPITFSILEYPPYFHFSVLTEEERLQAIDILNDINNSSAKGMEGLVLNSVLNYLKTSTENEGLLTAKRNRLALIEQQRNKLVRLEGLEPPRD